MRILEPQAVCCGEIVVNAEEPSPASCPALLGLDFIPMSSDFMPISSKNGPFCLENLEVQELFLVFEGECEAFYPKGMWRRQTGGHSDTGGRGSFESKMAREEILRGSSYSL